MKNINTPIIVERIVTDIDDIVKIVRFDGWQNTTEDARKLRKLSAVLSGEVQDQRKMFSIRRIAISSSIIKNLGRWY